MKRNNFIIAELIVICVMFTLVSILPIPNTANVARGIKEKVDGIKESLPGRYYLNKDRGIKNKVNY